MPIDRVIRGTIKGVKITPPKLDAEGEVKEGSKLVVQFEFANNSFLAKKMSLLIDDTVYVAVDAVQMNLFRSDGKGEAEPAPEPEPAETH